MDNILKLVVGVVGVIGLIVLMIPEGDPLSGKGNAAEGKLPSAAEESEAVPPKNVPPEPVGAPQAQITNFGQPMFDPTPPAQKALEQQQQQAQQQQTQQAGQSTANDPVIGAQPMQASGDDAPLKAPYPGQQ